MVYIVLLFCQSSLNDATFDTGATTYGHAQRRSTTDLSPRTRRRISLEVCAPHINSLRRRVVLQRCLISSKECGQRVRSRCEATGPCGESPRSRSQRRRRKRSLWAEESSDSCTVPHRALASRREDMVAETESRTHDDGLEREKPGLETLAVVGKGASRRLGR